MLVQKQIINSFTNPLTIYGRNLSDWMYNIVIIRRITRRYLWDLLSVISLQLLSGVINTYLSILSFEWNRRKEWKKDTMQVRMPSSLHPWDPSRQRAAFCKGREIDGHNYILADVVTKDLTNWLAWLFASSRHLSSYHRSFRLSLLLRFHFV